LKFTNRPNDVYFLLTMIAFCCALYNINTGRHFGGKINVHLLFILQEDQVYKVCQSEVEMKHYLECDPTNEADLMNTVYQLRS
jgi:hypothetical protein